MDQVKRLVAAGATMKGAINELLNQRGLTHQAFAEKYGRPRVTLTKVISGRMAPSSEDLDAFVGEFGGTREEWAELFWLASRPPHLGARVG